LANVSTPFVPRVIRKILRTVHPDLPARVEDQKLYRGLKRPAGDLDWRPLWRCPEKRLDAGATQVGEKLYVFGGYSSTSLVISMVDVLDLKRGAWCERFPMPATMAQSHLAVTSDGRRFVYAVSGQVGPQCHPATRACFVLDLETRTWSDLPALPEARYAATLQLWNGRLHVVGGSKEDRHTPATDHWSLAVSEGRAVETAWRTEVPIPRGGPHRASAILKGELFVFGGQEGDFVAIPGDPGFVCTGDLVDEWHHTEVHVLAPGAQAWRRAADLPVAASHTEFSTVQVGNRLILFGGQHHKDKQARVLRLTDAIQCYDADSDTWRVVGTLPYRVKTNVVGFHDGWVYSALGQRDRGPADPGPGDVVAHTWRAKVPASWPGQA
jgi:hypothetical protein